MRHILIVWSIIFCATVSANDYEDILTQYQTLVPPNDINTSTRNGYSLGSYSARFPIVPANNIVNFQAPSLSAGCGGIDLFGGSFSMINKDQAIALMRAIIANASGYAMQLALEGLCPTCNQIMAGLKKTIEQLNKLAKDSCAAGKALVNSLGGDDWSESNAMKKQKAKELAKENMKQVMANEGSNVGVWQGFTDGLTKIQSGESGWDITSLLPDGNAQISGSTIYDALNISGIINGTTTSTFKPLAIYDELNTSGSEWSSKEIVELLISLYGYSGFTNDKDTNPNSDGPLPVSYDGNILTAQVLLHGTDKFFMAECNNWNLAGGLSPEKRCDNPSPRSGSDFTAFEGVFPKVQKMLFGSVSDGSIGLLRKFDLINANDLQPYLTASQQNLWDSLAVEEQNAIKNLKGSDISAISVSSRIARNISESLINSLIVSTSTAVNSGLSELSKDGDGHTTKVKSYVETFQYNHKELKKELDLEYKKITDFNDHLNKMTKSMSDSDRRKGNSLQRSGSSELYQYLQFETN